MKPAPLIRISLVVAILPLTGCSQGDWTRLAWLPPAQTAESLVGAAAAMSFEPRYGGIHEDRGAEERMERIGARLAECWPGCIRQCRFRLLDCDDLNAASLPGHIYVTRELYAQLAGDDELAAVLAHEMAHMVARDSFRERCRTAEESLQRELAADSDGVERLAVAGYDPSAMARVLMLLRCTQPDDWYACRMDNIAQAVSARR